MKNLKLFVLLLAAFNSNAVAECYMQSSVVGQAKGSIEQVADIKHWTVPFTNNQRKCMVTFRGYAKHSWWNGVGEHVFSSAVTEDSACKVALERGKAQMIETVFGQVVLSEGQMICSDLPEIKVKPVSVGDVVQLSQAAPNQKGTIWLQS